MARKNTLVASILTLALVAPAALAAPVDVHVSAAGLDFATKALAGSGYKLSVSGPDGFLAALTFEGGAAPYFSAAGLADGYYKYELTALLDEPAGDERTIVLKSGPLASGTVLVRGGALVDPNLPESLEKAQVFNTDLIVDGSACIGIDCTSSESFGFDTLRLKENNLRIKFDDTSSSGSFPDNDWQLTANDSSNGGANKFSLDDVTSGKTPFTVEAGAPSHTLYVASEGRLGIGTSNPVVDVHAVSGNTPTLRLEQDGSNGFTAQTWDVAGNETNFFIRNVTGGSKLPFRIKPGAGDDSIFIDGQSEVGFGTDSPAGNLHIVDAGDAPRIILDNDAHSHQWNMRVTSAGTFRIEGDEDSATPHDFDFQTNGNLTLDGTVRLGTTSSGSNAGTAACIDSNGGLCACGSCS